MERSNGDEFNDGHRPHSQDRGFHEPQTSITNVNFLTTRKPKRVFEWCDLEITPEIIKSSAQALLTRVWILEAPGFTTPAGIAASILLERLFSKSRHRSQGDEAYDDQNVEQEPGDVLVVDFCSGAGGPTPTIETAVNQGRRAKGLPEARFLMTDLVPNVKEWENAVAQSGSANLSFVSESVDATDPPKDLMSSFSSSNVHNSQGQTTAMDAGSLSVTSQTRKSGDQSEISVWQATKVFRTFCLSFHHFSDPVARRVLASTMATSDGFAILELQDRRIFTMLTVSSAGLLCFAMSWLWFWGNWAQLFFTYIIPVVPFVLVWDGQVSCLRVREFEEILELIDGDATNVNVDERIEMDEKTLTVRKAGWIFESGRRKFMLLPGASVFWVTGRKL